MSRVPVADPPPSQGPHAGDRNQVYLHAGQLVAAASATAITTVLGSCVAVCLHDPVNRVGGMNHFLLPLHVERDRSARFGTIAVPQLVEAVVRAGASPSTLVAKVFGGASVIGAMNGRRLGDENARLAMELLDQAGIRVLDHDVGGSRGRKVVFFTDEGTAWVRQL